MKTILAAVLLFAAISDARAEKLGDGDLRRLIVGTWVPSREDQTGVPSKSTYNSDGSLMFIQFSDESCTRPIFHASGNWKIENGRLILTVIESSDPRSILRPGFVVADEILSISRNEKVLRGNSGQLQRRTRSSRCLNGTDT